MNEATKPQILAAAIMTLTANELRELRALLESGEGGDMAGVGALIPPNLPLKEGAAEVELPEDYWETAQ